MIEGPPTMPQNYSTTFSLLCTVTLATEVSNTTVNVDWLSPDGTAFNSTEGAIALDSVNPMMSSVTGSAVYIHVINFDAFRASDVGKYTCRVQINESIIKRSFPVSIEGNN